MQQAQGGPRKYQEKTASNSEFADANLEGKTASQSSKALDYAGRFQVVAVSGEQIKFDWLGGDSNLAVSVDRICRDLDQMRIEEGDWFSGTALVNDEGEVLRLKISEKTDPPELISDEDIDQFYHDIGAGKYKKTPPEK